MRAAKRGTLLWVSLGGLILAASVFHPLFHRHLPVARPFMPGAYAKSSVSPTTTGRRPSEAHGNLPLSFEVNQGQTDRHVKFLSRGSGYTLFLTEREAVLGLKLPGNQSPGTNAARDLRGRHGKSLTATEYLRMKLAGANATPSVLGLNELPGRSNYFIGNDPKQWRTDVPTYAKVKYKQVYPGVDVVYYGNQGQLEYDFVVAPGANPKTIRLNFRGAKKLRIDNQNALIVLKTKNGDVRFKPPVAFQQLAVKRETVDARFTLITKDTVGFEIGNYDRSKPLIIDPVLAYSTYLGGSGFDFGTDIKADASGNAYVTGSTSSTNFPTANALQPSLLASPEVFVSKLNPSGSALVFSTYLGGSKGSGSLGGPTGGGIAVDSGGNVYVTSGTASTDFPTTAGAFQPSLSGSGNAFVSKLNPTGSALVYSTYLGGSGGSTGGGIAVDSAGNAYVTGSAGANFPTANAFQPNPGNTSGGNAFVSKLNPNGSALVYSTYLGGNGTDMFGISGDYGDAIAVDSAGNAYVAGWTGSTNFPVANAIQPTNHGLDNAFISKFNSSGSALIYSTYLGGSNRDGANSIALDSSSNAYVTGEATSTDFPTANAFQSNFLNKFAGSGSGADNAFVSKLNATGSALIYSTYLGGSGCAGGPGDKGDGIAVDSSGDAYISGQTCSTDFPTASALQAVLKGSQNAFISEFNVGGSGLVFSTFLGGSNGDGASRIALDSSNNAYITGGTTSTDFPTVKPFQASLGGSSATNAFIAKLSFVPAVSISPTTLTFPPQLVGTSSASQTVTVQDTGDGQLTVTSISSTGTNSADFADSSDNCVSSSPIGPSGTCTINVTFKPGGTGGRAGTLSVADNAAGSPHTVSMSGTGTDFSIGAGSGGSTSATVNAGQTATYNLQVSPISGFTGTVSVSCSGAPTQASCTPSTSSVNVTNASAVAFSVNVPTTAHGLVPPNPITMRWPHGPMYISLVLLMLALLVLRYWRASANPVRTARHGWALAGLLVAFLASVASGCNGGSGGGGGTPAGSYTLTVTGTDQGVQHTVSLSLTVN